VPAFTRDGFEYLRFPLMPFFDGVVWEHQPRDRGGLHAPATLAQPMVRIQSPRGEGLRTIGSGVGALSWAIPPAMPGMLRKSTAFVPRYHKFESISLQRRVRKLSVPA
jgi:hypothetical protein